MIIGINGYAGSGKDAFAKIMREYDERWEIKKFAGKLKSIASELTGIPANMFEDHSFKNTEMPEWGMTVREFLQKLGTEAIRDSLHKDSWVNALMSEYLDRDENVYTANVVRKLRTRSRWIITDVRFPNEAEAIKSKKGMVVRIDRPGVVPINNHYSEIGLDGWDFDYYIANDGDLNDLRQKVKLFIHDLI